MAEEKEKTSKEEPEEAPEQGISGIETIGNFLSPYGIMLLIIAGLLDVVGLILLCFGLDDLWITDIIGLVFIGGLMLIGPGKVTVTKGVQKMVEKAGKKLLKRFGLAFLVEIIPWVGGIAPSWTVAVYFHLKGS